MNEDDLTFLRQAIALAQTARLQGERPFGAVLAFNGQVVAQASDSCRALRDPTAHAELLLISQYCRTHPLINLDGSTLYSCGEPCVMCSGAIKWARISRVVFSVPQAMIQQVSSGRVKPSCESIVNTGNRQIEVLGPCLLEEGWPVYQDFDFAAHQRLLWQHADNHQAG